MVTVGYPVPKTTAARQGGCGGFQTAVQRLLLVKLHAQLAAHSAQNNLKMCWRTWKMIMYSLEATWGQPCFGCVRRGGGGAGRRTAVATAGWATLAAWQHCSMHLAVRPQVSHGHHAAAYSDPAQQGNSIPDKTTVQYHF